MRIRTSLSDEGLGAVAQATLSGEVVGDNVPAAQPFRQKARRYMSKRAGQTGALISRHGRWVGRFYIDTPDGRTRKAVVLGLRNELSKTEAKLKLLNLITGE